MFIVMPRLATEVRTRSVSSRIVWMLSNRISYFRAWDKSQVDAIGSKYTVPGPCYNPDLRKDY